MVSHKTWGHEIITSKRYDGILIVKEYTPDACEESSFIHKNVKRNARKIHRSRFEKQQLQNRYEIFQGCSKNVIYEFSEYSMTYDENGVVCIFVYTNTKILELLPPFSMTDVFDACSIDYFPLKSISYNGYFQKLCVHEKRISYLNQSGNSWIILSKVFCKIIVISHIFLSIILRQSILQNIAHF